MIRNPTEAELQLINALAKRKCAAEEFYVIEANIANDFMLTSYKYHIGTSSLYNYRSELQQERLRMGTSHKRDLPLGRWLPGEVLQVQPPANAKAGKNSVLKAPMYMAKGMKIGMYETDQIAKAYEMGIITDVSIEWNGGKPVCDICGGDIRSYEECKHIPGRMYDGVMCTFTVEDSHLGACDIVDDGGLPMATLSDTDEEVNLADKDGTIQWENIKKIPLNKLMKGRLMLSLREPTAADKQEEKDMTFAELQVQFKEDIEKTYVLKADYDQMVADLTTAQGELAATKETLTAKEAELADMTQKHAEAVADLAVSADMTTIGKVYIQSLKDEYNRLGVAVYGDKWDHEAKAELVDKMQLADQEKFLKSETALMLEQNKNLGGRHTTQTEAGKDKPYSHRDNPALYT
jgi:hypothetical protein